MILGVRSPNACLRCRRAKTKCLRDDDSLPCRSCAKAHHECVFSQKAVRKRRAIEHPTSSVAAAVSPGPTRTIRGDDERLPPAVIDECQQIFFKCLCPWASFHQPTIQRQIREGTLEPCLYYAMLALCGRTSPALVQMYGSPAAASDHFARRAMGFAFEALDHPSIATIQAIYLVTLQEWGARRGSRAFIYIAMAIRMVQMLKPAIETGSGQDFVVAETARRVLWTCFMMEQFLSSGKDRPTMLRDEDLRISLPCSEQDYHFGTPTIVPMLNGELPHAVGPDSRVSEIGEFGHMILIARLWRGVVTWIFEPSPQDNEDESQYQRLLEELYHWHDSLPARLQNRSGQIDLHITMGTGFPFAFIHCVFHCAIIFLHRRRLHLLGRQSNSTPNNNISSSSRDPWQVQTIDAIFSSASAITSLLTALESPSSQAYIFPLFTLFSSYTAATTVAYMSIRELIPQARSTSITIVRDNLRILRGMRESWALVEEWYEELGEMIKVLQNRAMGKHDGERGFGMEDEEYSSLQLSGRSQTGQSPMSVSNSPTHHLAQQLASQGTPSTTSTSLEAAAVLERMRDPRDGNGSAGGLGTPHMGPSNPQEGMAILSLYEEQLATSGDLAAFLGSEQYANGSH